MEGKIRATISVAGDSGVKTKTETIEGEIIFENNHFVTVQTYNSDGTPRYRTSINKHLMITGHAEVRHVQ